MVKLIFKLTGLVVVEALVLASAIVWALGRPTEAQAIVRLDGAEAVPLTPLGLRTCYAPGFTHAGFLAIRQGESMESVRSQLGPPIQVIWADHAKGQRTIRFDLRRGHYVVSATDGVPIALGASMESLASLRSEFQETRWDYSRQCTPLDSNRIRVVFFDAGRVTRRFSGVYYD